CQEHSNWPQLTF
nr:immunoglobulin light chain junction region [Macaca mulatta]